MAILKNNWLAATGLVVFFVLLALLAPWLAPHDPAAIDLPSRLHPPGAGHWLGTDELGRDILSRIVYGSRISMLVGGSVVAGSLLLGLIFGSIAGYYGGMIDRKDAGKIGCEESACYRSCESRSA
jgi:peptide/nickel transport system permease protein